MNREQKWHQPIIESHDGIELENENGSTVVMDRSARIAAFVDPRPGVPDLEELAQKQLCKMLVDANQQNKTPLRFHVHTDLEAVFCSPDVRQVIQKLVAGLMQLGNVDLTIDFSRPPRDWHLFAGWAYRLLREERKLLDHVHLRGPFPPLADDVKDAFDDLGIRLNYVAGWRLGAESDSGEIAHPNALGELARSGFRIPVIYYVTAGNLHQAEKVIESGLRRNEHSGFAVPAIFHHLEFDPASSPAPPSANSYTELLVRLYRNFPHYDDIFEPVTELAELMREGNWDSSWEVPAILRLIVRPERGITIFRQVPGQAIPWVSCADLLSWSLTDIAPRLLSFHRQRYAWSKHAFCGKCQWRYVCGGSDAVSLRSDEADEIARAACEHRMMFLEEFARKKAESAPLRLPVIPQQTTESEWIMGGPSLALDLLAPSAPSSRDAEAD